MSIGRAGKQGKGLHSKNREEGLLGEQGACGQLPTCLCALLLTEENVFTGKHLVLCSEPSEPLHPVRLSFQSYASTGTFFSVQM